MMIEERIQKLPTISLRSGMHPSFSDGVCAMEAVAWLAGEPHTDHPECACPVIAGVVRQWNDALPDESRNTLLRPLLSRIVGSRVDDDNVMMRRMWLVLDWDVRVRTPAFLRLAGLGEHAAVLKSLPEIVDFDSLTACTEIVRSASRAARDAAFSAARAARAAASVAASDVASAEAREVRHIECRAAAHAAGRAAASAAAYAATYEYESAYYESAHSAREERPEAYLAAAYLAAAYSVSEATRDAAYSAARAAAYSAASGAVRDIFADTVADLQTSLVRVIERMCALTTTTSPTEAK